MWREHVVYFLRREIVIPDSWTSPPREHIQTQNNRLFYVCGEHIQKITRSDLAKLKATFRLTTKQKIIIKDRKKERKKRKKE